MIIGQQFFVPSDYWIGKYLNNQFKNKKAPDARRAFPCFDEPAFKATFDITIIAEKDKTVLSNMVS